MAMKGEKMSPAEKRAKAKFQKKPSEVRKRVQRNKDRRKAMREGKVKKGDGKHVDHINGDAKGPTRIRSERANVRDNKRGKRKK
jgi:hypothetical protein